MNPRRAANPLCRVVRHLFLCIVVVGPICTVWASSSAGEATEDIKLPQELWNVAFEYAKAKGIDLTRTSVDQLYQVAKGLSNHDATREKALRILHVLADDGSMPHSPSQVALGLFYYNQAKHYQSESKDGDNTADQRQKALQYFLSAGEQGGSTAGLYNAGRIYAQLGQFVPAMAYVHAAATAGDETAEDENHQHGHYLEETAVEAFEILSHKVAILVQSDQMTLREYADVFFYGNLHKESETEETVSSLWTQAMQLADKVDQANATLAVDSGDSRTSSLTLSAQQAVQFQENLIQQLDPLVQLWKLASSNSQGSFSMLQAFLLVHHVLRRVLLPLISWQPLLEHIEDKNKDYVPAAAGYAEAMALSPFCSGTSEDHSQSASKADEVSCLDETAQLALGLYQQVNDISGVRRMKELLLQQQQEQRPLKDEREL